MTDQSVIVNRHRNGRIVAVPLSGGGCRKITFGIWLVMPGLVPGTHVFAAARKTWIAGTKPGHDDNQIIEDR
jgi:hypothetical protein